MYTVVGAPFPSSQYSLSELDKAHADYCAAVQSLYDRYKDEFEMGHNDGPHARVGAWEKHASACSTYHGEAYAAVLAAHDPPLRVQDVGAAGDCLFFCTSALLVGDPREQQVYREKVASWLEANPESDLARRAANSGVRWQHTDPATGKKEVVLDPETGRMEPMKRPVHTLAAYCEYIRAHGYGGFDVDLQILANLEEVDFEIIPARANSHPFNVVCQAPQSLGAAPRPMYTLAHVGTAHVQLLLPVDRARPNACGKTVAQHSIGGVPIGPGEEGQEAAALQASALGSDRADFLVCSVNGCTRKVVRGEDPQGRCTQCRKGDIKPMQSADEDDMDEINAQIKAMEARAREAAGGTSEGSPFDIVAVPPHKKWGGNFTGVEMRISREDCLQLVADTGLFDSKQFFQDNKYNYTRADLLSIRHGVWPKGKEELHLYVLPWVVEELTANWHSAKRCLSAKEKDAGSDVPIGLVNEHGRAAITPRLRLMPQGFAQGSIVVARWIKRIFTPEDDIKKLLALPASDFALLSISHMDSNKSTLGKHSITPGLLEYESKAANYGRNQCASNFTQILQCVQSDYPKLPAQQQFDIATGMTKVACCKSVKAYGWHPDGARLCERQVMRAWERDHVHRLQADLKEDDEDDGSGNDDDDDEEEGDRDWSNSKTSVKLSDADALRRFTEEIDYESAPSKTYPATGNKLFAMIQCSDLNIIGGECEPIADNPKSKAKHYRAAHDPNGSAKSRKFLYAAVNQQRLARFVNHEPDPQATVRGPVGGKPMQCLMLCRKSFRDVAALLGHIIIHLPADDPLRVQVLQENSCPDCNLGTIQASNLVDHLQRVHKYKPADAHRLADEQRRKAAMSAIQDVAASSRSPKLSISANGKRDTVELTSLPKATRKRRRDVQSGSGTSSGGDEQSDSTRASGRLRSHAPVNYGRTILHGAKGDEDTTAMADTDAGKGEGQESDESEDYEPENDQK